MPGSDAPGRRPRRRRPRAGKQLREEMDKALEHARREQQQPLLEFSELELAALERAAAAADRAEELRGIYDAEMTGEQHPTSLVKLSSEVRLLDKQVVDLISRINFGVGPAKSARHQYSANRRWHGDGA